MNSQKDLINKMRLEDGIPPLVEDIHIDENERDADDYVVQLMTENYRVGVLTVINKILGDPSKEVAMFCGIPTEIVVDDAMDARYMWFEQMADETSNQSGCELHVSEFVKEMFGGS